MDRRGQQTTMPPVSGCGNRTERGDNIWPTPPTAEEYTYAHTFEEEFLLRSFRTLELHSPSSCYMYAKGKGFLRPMLPPTASLDHFFACSADRRRKA